MFKKVVRVFLCCFLLSNCVLAASSFNDVPADHWSRQAIDYLAARGIVQGTIDTNSFAGNKPATRFELAQIFIRTLANIEQLTGSSDFRPTVQDLEQIKRLTDEFADELTLMGVRRASLDEDLAVVRVDISQLRQRVDEYDREITAVDEKIKLSGDMLVRHTTKSHRTDYAINSVNPALRAFGNSNNAWTETQLRLRAMAKIDENISFTTRIRFFNRGSDVVTAAPSNRGGAWGANGIGRISAADMTVDAAFLEIKKIFDDKDRFLFGCSAWHNGHGILLSNDFSSIRYAYAPKAYELFLQYVYDRHIGNYKDTGAVDFRGLWNLGARKKINNNTYYVNLYAQDEPNMVNRRIAANTFVLGTLPGEQKSDSRKDVEFGGSAAFGRDASGLFDYSFVFSSYQGDINKPAAGNIIDADMNGFAAYSALTWKADAAFKARLAYAFADDEFMGAYLLSVDRRYAMGNETPYEDIARGNQWFNRGLFNMSMLKLQAEYTPVKTRHYFRLAAHFLDEVKNHVDNRVAHHLAGNANGLIPAGFNQDNSSYDTFNNVGIADPEMLILNFEYRYKLSKNAHLRIGYVDCSFAGDARRATLVNPAIKAGRGWNNDFDYRLLWTELYSRF